MFFTTKKKRISRAADDFLETLVKRVDDGYRIFIQETVQIFADAGMTLEEIESFATNEMTKIYFLIGECAAQMLASNNLFGEKTGNALNAEITRKMEKLTLQRFDYSSANDIGKILGHCRMFPMDSRVTVVLFILQRLGFQDNKATQTIGENELFRTLIDSTSMSDGIMGVAKDVSKRHRLPSS